jgi:hypothetical protein
MTIKNLHLLNLTRKSNVFIAKVWDIPVSTVTGLVLVMIALPTIPSRNVMYFIRIKIYYRAIHAEMFI